MQYLEKLSTSFLCISSLWKSAEGSPKAVAARFLCCLKFSSILAQMYDGDNFLSAASFYTIKMLTSDLTVASVVKVKSQILWHCQSLKGCFLGNECLGVFTGPEPGLGWMYDGLAS